MEVVENEYERLPCCKQLEQLAHGSVAPVALVVGVLAPGGEQRERRKDGGELLPDVVVERDETTLVEAMDVVVQGVDKNSERQVAFEL